MARIRQIKPEFALDEELAANCCRDARMMFILMWPITDREGRLEDRPAKIKAQCFPYDDDITVAKIVEFIDQLCAGGWIFRYEVDGRRYLWVRTFTVHQHFHRDEQSSKLPEPPTDIKIHRASTVVAPHLHADFYFYFYFYFWESGIWYCAFGANRCEKASHLTKNRLS